MNLQAPFARFGSVAAVAVALTASALASPQGWTRTLTSSREAPTFSNTLVPTGSGGFVGLARLYIPETGLFEQFMIQVPATPPSQERPLLVAFHSFGASHADIYFNTNYLVEARTRDWFLIAPLQNGGPGGLWDRSYGTVASQIHVEAVIQLALDLYPIDRDRIYGVGFSMGGGNVMNYAARHRDRRSGAFAAVVNHTGTVALSDVHRTTWPANRMDMETLFSGPPPVTPFEWTRCSSIILDTQGQLIQGADHMAINLARTPVRSIAGVGDPMLELVSQTMELDAFFQGIPGSMHDLQTPTATCGHCWQTANETAVCNWLATHTLDLNPASGTVLADRSARWGRFDVEQAVGGSFTRFDFAVDVPMNRLEVTGASNLESVGVRLPALQLDPLQTVDLDLRAVDSNGVTLKIRNVTTAPISVVRDGVTLGFPDCTGGASPSWCFYFQPRELVIFEPSAGSWEVTL